MTAEEFLDRCADIGINTRRKYSGCGMHGKTCIACIVPQGDSIQNIIAQLFDFAICEAVTLGEAQDISADLLRIIGAACTDSMGLDTVLYFPSISVEKETA